MRKLGLVFSGGGAKGAYEIGVWKALNEFGMDAEVQAVSGTSVGALNGALFVQGDLNKAEQLWSNIQPAQIMAINKEDIAKNLLLLAMPFFGPSQLAKIASTIISLSQFQGIFNQQGLESLIDQSGVCHNLVSKSKLPFHVCCFSFNNRELHYPCLNKKSPEDIKKWLLASSAIPILFDGINIGSDTYYDGGVLPGDYGNNTPYEILIKEHQCNRIINIFLENSPDIIAHQKSYPDVRFWNIVPSKPIKGIIPELDFDPDTSSELIQLGYQDTLNILQQFQSFHDTEQRYQDAVFDYAQKNQQFEKKIEVNYNIRSEQSAQAQFKTIMSEIQDGLEQYEIEQVNYNMERLVDDMQENSIELLDEAFNAIAILASSKGAINEHLEKNRFFHILGNITGRNNQIQSEINAGLHQAIYATQLLIDKLNKKTLLTMEAVVALENKTNYLMDHINYLYGDVQQLKQRQYKMLSLIEQSMSILQNQFRLGMQQLDQRIQVVERNHLFNNWYHKVKVQYANDTESPYRNLLNITADFYTNSGRQWDNNELNYYINAINDIGLGDELMMPATLIWSSAKSDFLEQISAENILPIAPEKRAQFPLLYGLQKISDQSTSERNTNICTEIEQQYRFNLFGNRTAKELGIELLYACRRNDKRAPENTTKLLSSPQQTGLQASAVQKNWLAILDNLENIVQKQQFEEQIAEDLSYLSQQIADFKVIIPLVGKFSSGKSTLLNRYLGKHCLNTDINPETAIATELHYGTKEKLEIHYHTRQTPECRSITDLSTLDIKPDMAFLRAYLNLPVLKNRSQITLVDMPGFDAPGIAHQQAIAQYLKRGDFFVAVFPANNLYDNSVIERLYEIKQNYQKPLVCLLSRSARLKQETLEKNQQALKDLLESQTTSSVDIRPIESRAKSQYGIQAFKDYLDKASQQFDTLLRDRYQEPMLKLIERIEQGIQRQLQFAENPADELVQQAEQAEHAFKVMRDELQRNLKTLHYNLCSIGTEAVLNKLKEILFSMTEQLKSKTTTSEIMTVIDNRLRPVLQAELDYVVQNELQRFEQQLDMDNQNTLSSIQSNIEIPAQEKESFSFLSASVTAIISSFFLGPSGTVITSVLAGIIGRQDNEQKRQQEIEGLLNNEIYPQVIEQYSQQINQHLEHSTAHLTSQLNTRLAKQQQQYQKEAGQRQEQLNKKNRQFSEHINTLKGLLHQIQSFKNEL